MLVSEGKIKSISGKTQKTPIKPISIGLFILLILGHSSALIPYFRLWLSPKDLILHPPSYKSTPIPFPANDILFLQGKT